VEYIPCRFSSEWNNAFGLFEDELLDQKTIPTAICSISRFYFYLKLIKNIF